MLIDIRDDKSKNRAIIKVNWSASADTSRKNGKMEKLFKTNASAPEGHVKNG